MSKRVLVLLTLVVLLALGVGVGVWAATSDGGCTTTTFKAEDTNRPNVMTYHKTDC